MLDGGIVFLSFLNKKVLTCQNKNTGTLWECPSGSLGRAAQEGGRLTEGLQAAGMLLPLVTMKRMASKEEEDISAQLLHDRNRKGSNMKLPNDGSQPQTSRKSPGCPGEVAEDGAAQRRGERTAAPLRPAGRWSGECVKTGGFVTLLFLPLFAD